MKKQFHVAVLMLVYVMCDCFLCTKSGRAVHFDLRKKL